MALWMADLLKMFNIDGKVHSIDINPDSIDPEVKKREDIDLIEGDCRKIHESLADAKMKVSWMLKRCRSASVPAPVSAS